jgi:hypothetical protein
MTEGEPLEHDWVEIVAGSPRVCATCGKTEGGAADSRFDPEKCEKLFGTWYGEQLVTGEFLGMTGCDEEVMVATTITFNDDGTYTMVATVDDQEAFEKMIEEFLYAQFEGFGMSRTEIDLLLAAQGQTMQGLVEESCKEILGQETQGVYYVANDELYMGESWDGEMIPDEIVVDGDQLTVYNADLDQTMVLTKV